MKESYFLLLSLCSHSSLTPQTKKKKKPIYLSYILERYFCYSSGLRFIYYFFFFLFRMCDLLDGVVEGQVSISCTRISSFDFWCHSSKSLKLMSRKTGICSTNICSKHTTSRVWCNVYYSNYLWKKNDGRQDMTTYVKYI